MKRVLPILFLCLFGTISSAREYTPGDHELIFMPTAYTVPAGHSYFSDYQILFLNYTYAPTNSTHLGIFTLFPITTDFLQSLTFGAKQRVFENEKVACALWGSYTPEGSLGTFGGVTSFGRRKLNGHIGIAAVTTFEEHVEFIYMLGIKGAISEKTSLLAEYTNSSSALDLADFAGLISLGARFVGDQVAWEIAGIRPLQGAGDIVLIPLLKATVYFK